MVRIGTWEKMIFTPLELSIMGTMKNDFESCYPIVSLIVYRRAIKQLIPLKEEKFKTFKGLEDSSGYWKGFKWPSMTVKWPSKSNSNFRWFDTVWLVRKWLRRISLKDSSGCLKPFEASRRPSWRISEGSRRISHEGDPVRINSQILIRQKDEKHAESAC